MCPSCLQGTGPDPVQKRAPLEVIGGSSVLPESKSKPVDPRAKMSEGEKSMANVLDAQLRAGELRRWWYESFTLRVGIERCDYTPDFVLLLADGSLEVIEVKGKKKWEDSIIKWKSAALEYPIARWRMIEWAGGSWRTLYDVDPREKNAEEEPNA